MKCEKCNKREATTHFKKNINGYIEEHHLCSECAKKSPELSEIKQNMNFGLGGFLGGMFSGTKPQHSLDTEQSTDICPTCKMTYSEFLQKGKLGCGDCYSTFRNRIKRPLKQIHGTFEHIGKAPERCGEKVILDKKIKTLEAELNAAVLKQEFETAAKLRDEIKLLKSSGTDKEA